MQTHEQMTDTPSHIEADLARERAALASSLDALRDRLSVDALLRDGVGLLQRNAAPYARMVDEAVRANPLAVGLTGIGLAWLILGRRTAQAQHSPDNEVLAGTPFEALSRWEDEGGPVAPLCDPEDAWVEQADDLRAKAAEALRALDAKARDGLSTAADLARERAAVLADLTRDVRSALGDGLAGLSDAARTRIMSAREAAYAVHVETRQRSRRMIEDRPLTCGAIAALAGAALAAALPQTEAEHRMLGAPRDRLMDEARRALAEEQARAAEVAAALARSLSADLDRATGKVNQAAAVLASGAEPAGAGKLQ